MEPLMLIGTVIGILAAIAGIIAAIVQVREYREKRREKSDETTKRNQPSTPLPVPKILHNLPPRTEFIGREAEKARVHEGLLSRLRLVSIDGIGGIGKTVLALEVAHECLQARKGEGSTDGIATFEGFIWTTAKDRELTLGALLDAIARTLDYPGIARKPVEDKKIGVQRLLQDRPHLLIVDNLDTVTDKGVRDFLTDLPEPSKALITTREQKLRQVWAVSLKGLEEPEALTLIRGEGKRLHLTSLERGEDQTLLRLCQATGGVPLAIKWAVGQIKRGGQPLDMVLAALREASEDIFDDIFARSWNLLSASARQILIVMPIFATSALWAGIEAASNVHHLALQKALGQLIEMSLIDTTDELDLARRRYSIHPLTRMFAGKKLKQEPETQEDAKHRLAEYFRQYSRENGGPWNLGGFDLLEADLPNILAIVQWCWESEHIKIGIDIFREISDCLRVRGYWNDAMDLGRDALELSTGLGDELSAAVFRVWPIGWILRHRDELDSAEEQVTQALNVLERLGAERDLADAKRNLGRIAQKRGELDRAEQLLREALESYKTVGPERQVYLATSNIAEVALERGDLNTAWELCDKVLESAKQLGHPVRIAHLQRVLGSVASQRGDFQQAKDFWKNALDYLTQAKRRDEIANLLVMLARIEMEMGKKQIAKEMLARALESYQRLDIESGIREVEDLLVSLLEFTVQIEKGI